MLWAPGTETFQVTLERDSWEDRRGPTCSWCWQVSRKSPKHRKERPASHPLRSGAEQAHASAGEHGPSRSPAQGCFPPGRGADLPSRELAHCVSVIIYTVPCYSYRALPASTVNRELTEAQTCAPFSYAQKRLTANGLNNHNHITTGHSPHPHTVILSTCLSDTHWENGCCSGWCLLFLRRKTDKWIKALSSRDQEKNKTILVKREKATINDFLH